MANDTTTDSTASARKQRFLESPIQKLRKRNAEDEHNKSDRERTPM